MSPDKLAEELHAAERVAALEQLHKDLANIDSDKARQRTFNIIISIAVIAASYVIWTNHQSLDILKKATGPDAQAASAAVIQGIKCDTRQALGEALASLGIKPPPLSPGCPPYTVTVAPHEGQPEPQPATAQPAQTAAPAPGSTTVVMVPVSQSRPADTEPPQPEQAPPTTTPTTEPSTPPTTEPPSEKPPEKPDTCALGVALFGCVVTASTGSAVGAVGGVLGGVL